MLQCYVFLLMTRNWKKIIYTQRFCKNEMRRVRQNGGKKMDCISHFVCVCRCECVVEERNEAVPFVLLLYFMPWIRFVFFFVKLFLVRVFLIRLRDLHTKINVSIFFSFLFFRRWNYNANIYIFEMSWPILQGHVNWVQVKKLLLVYPLLLS